MIIEINELESQGVIKVGSIIVSEDDDVMLVIENENVFNVFDLEDNVLRCYDRQIDFELDYNIREIYEGDEIKIKLNKF